ncbi:response regulator transcription factor [Microbispora sp. NEAU-D428]|uniref:response regulator n=1 Tax=Microbispora sitophila TaxID=2771537 RepID=UPI001865B7DA|nr:response regulator [Microbispora sitophila]MBE3016058.1 response regulator transcription factor [Microbispora sitophila]
MVHSLPPEPAKHQVLVVDDDDDVHRITEIVLKPLTFQDRGVELLRADTAAQAVEIMRTTPGVSVILLDVVMESAAAGLEACRFIREELGNHFVRILLRTGQPGTAPEERVVQDYDIDGYLPKSELTSTRLRTAVRTALKAYSELSDLESHRNSLESIRESMRDLSGPSAWSDFGDKKWPVFSEEGE